MECRMWLAFALTVSGPTLESFPGHFYFVGSFGKCVMLTPLVNGYDGD